MDKIEPGMLVTWRKGKRKYIGLCIRQHSSSLFVDDYCCEVLTNNGQRKALLASVLREVPSGK